MNTYLPRPRSIAAVPLAALLAVLAAMLLAVAPAGAAPAKISKVFGGPVASSNDCSPDGTANKTDASEFTDFCVAFRATNDEGPAGVDLKSQVVDTPQGFAGIADAFPQCTDAQFAKSSENDAGCAGNTQMGQVTAAIRARLSDGTAANPLVTVPLGSAYDGSTKTVSLTPTGAVYNLTHSENEVARLGIDLRPVAAGFIDQPNVKIIVRVTLRPSPDVGLRSIIDDMPNSAHVKVSIPPLVNVDEVDPLAVDDFNLLFWGPQRGSMPRGFAFMGADCSNTQETKINATAYNGSTTSGASKTYKLTDCDDPKIQFKPGVAFSTAENRPDVTTETTVRVTFGDSDDAGYQVAGPKKTVVVLPGGLSFSGQIASGANGLPLCTPEQYGQYRAEASNCPAATAVGTVSFKSPVQTRLLTGNVYLGSQPAAGELPDIYIEAQEGPAADAPRVKLVGKLTVDDQNRIVTTLDDLPEVPVTEFKLTFRGGDQAAVVTPPTCGTTQGALAAYAFNKPGSASNKTADYKVDSDCDAVGAKSAALAFVGANPNAGQYGAFTTTINRPDRSARLSRAVVNLPPGEVANLKGVPECLQADAAQSKCPASSLVGTVTSLAGVGPAPYRATGQVYLTNRSEGAAAGVSLHVPVKFGEVYLGDLNVPGRIEIREDLGLRFSADIPERFKGIPLNIREFSVSLDRKDFGLNPTSCAPLSTTSQVTSGGTVLDLTAGYQVSACDKLRFEPKLDAAVLGQTGNKGRPTIQVRIENPALTGNLKQTTVTLPKGVGVDLTQIPRSCPQETFAAGACPDNARIGTLDGSLSIADDKLGGYMYLLKPVKGKVLPGVGLQFTGRFAGRVVGSTAVDPKTGQLVTDFPTVPDLPLTTLQINIAGGTGGPVIATEELCKTSSVQFNGAFAAHSGQTATRTVKTKCGQPLAANSAKISGRVSNLRKGKPVLRMAVTAPTKITKIEFTLPSGWALASQKKGRKASTYIKVDRLSVKKSATVKRLSARKVRITMPKGGSTKFHFLSRTGTISVKSSKARKTKSKLTFSAKVTAEGQTYTVPFKFTPR
ncbi:MAG: hypothetical protein J7513_06050 [Solirubrobacteraceae bacterium]|nr:hypothetical protein [Solirubrobacteraceae bacterium]